MKWLALFSILLIGLGASMSAAAPVPRKAGLPPAKSAFGVSLVAKARPQYTSGGKIVVRLMVVNHGKLPFCFEWPFRASYMLHFRARYGPGDLRSPGTAFGVEKHPSSPIFVGSGFFQFQACMPGHTMDYWSIGGPRLPAGRFVDLTLPGAYRLQISTRFPPHLSKHATVDKLNVMVSLGANITLSLRAAGPHLVTEGRMRSNWVKIKIVPPYQKLPPRALVPAKGLGAKPSAAMKPGLRIELVKPVVKGPGPFAVHALFIDDGHKPITVRLTGNPLVDFKSIQVHGPSYLDRGFNAHTPRPHWVTTIPAVPKFTAYGRWLLKHPPKKLPTQTYTLKPGVVYRYAVPINLSCQYDLSLYGHYHARVELANPKVWSNWKKVEVPPIWDVSSD